MNNKGFTLIELLVVIAILGLSIGFVAINFNAISGTNEKIEEESIAKGIAEAAYVLIDSSKDNLNHTFIDYDGCYDAVNCLKNIGYIPEDQGLLTTCDDSCLKEYYYQVILDSGQKIVNVYKSTSTSESSCMDNTGKCSGTAIFTYGG